MAKEKPEAKLSKDERRALKKEKKEKEAAPVKVKTNGKVLTADAGVSKPKSDKKEKKDKKSSKEKKEKREVLAEKILNEIQSAEEETEEKAKEKQKDVDKAVDVDMGTKSSDDEAEVEEAKKKRTLRPVGALVPFANPLADEKVGKKIFKTVKKAAGHRTLKRGVKEVVKALRKSAANPPPPASSAKTSSLRSTSTPQGIVVLAADISPMDVISHIPVLCEDHNIPYIYVTSRAELGMASQTKRPTSVVLVSRDLPAGRKNVKDKEKEKSEGGTDADAKADAKAGSKEDWEEAYKGLVKVVDREGRHVKI